LFLSAFLDGDISQIIKNIFISRTDNAFAFEVQFLIAVRTPADNTMFLRENICCPSRAMSERQEGGTEKN
jgi:hypothetical protein